jgi:lipopolysaccharide transport system ATP-binding protein
MYQVEALCDRVVWLDGGRVRKVGNPVEVITEYSEMVSLASPKEEGLGTVSKADRDKIGEKPDHKNTLTLPALQKIAISVDGHEGKVHKVVSQQSDLEITVQFSPGEGVPMPSVAVAFSGGDGRIISSTGSYHDNIALKTNAEGKVRSPLCFQSWRS